MTSWTVRDASEPITVGFLLYPSINQIDLTAPYEVLARMPNVALHIIAQHLHPIREERGLLLTPTVTLADAPPLDVLVVPGGRGQQDVMENEALIGFIRRQPLLLSVCTGALLLGAAGLLRGRRATTHWAAVGLLHHFGAEYSHERCTLDGRILTCAGVTAGIDGALRVVALLRGQLVAAEIELAMQYAPEPPLHCGTPETAPAAVLESTRAKFQALTEQREITARRIISKHSTSAQAPDS